MEFPSTHWTALAQASLHGDTSAEKALESFCAQYRPLIIIILRSRGMPPDRLEDLAHDFLLQLMRSSALKRADPRRGRFRAFLSGALSNFLADDGARHHAAKRGGGVAPLSLDAADTMLDLVATEDADAALALDREWALHLVARALERVRQQWHGPEKSDRFAVLRVFLPGASESLSQQEAARRLGLSDEALRKELQRLRESLRVAISREVAATVASEEEVDGEMRHLMHVLQAAPAPSPLSLSQTRHED
ncbi:MAG: RNA polymerase sigma factor [Verrucomicrobiales bacterium]